MQGLPDRVPRALESVIAEKLSPSEFPRSSSYDLEWVLENLMGPNVLWLAESLTSVMDLRPGMRVLDMGCGKAVSSIFLAKEFGIWVGRPISGSQRLRTGAASARRVSKSWSSRFTPRHTPCRTPTSSSTRSSASTPTTTSNGRPLPGPVLCAAGEAGRADWDRRSRTRGRVRRRPARTPRRAVGRALRLLELPQPRLVEETLGKERRG